jgi:hypothetical protein
MWMMQKRQFQRIVMVLRTIRLKLSQSRMSESELIWRSTSSDKRQGKYSKAHFESSLLAEKTRLKKQAEKESRSK